LAHRLKSEREELSFLLTTGAAVRPESRDGLIAQFAPDDNLPGVQRFLDHWRPNLAVWTEPDLRPALIAETAQRECPMYLIDARTARPDLAAWRWRRPVSSALLDSFERVLTGDEDTAAVYRRLGAPPARLDVLGYLEEGTAAPPCHDGELAAMTGLLAGRPVWLAMAVTEAEREAVLRAHAQAERRAHRLLLILVPADPDAGEAWAAELTAQGDAVRLRSVGEEPDPDTQIYIADTDEEAGLWYRLAPVAFLGRSLGSGGGINPFEAAALGSAILHGPNLRAHRTAYDRLLAAEATRLVRDAEELGAAVEALLSPDVAACQAHAAWQVCSSGAEVTDRAMGLILDTLDTDRGP